MQHGIRQSQHLTEKVLIQKLKKSAQMYNAIAGKKLLFIYQQSKNSAYEHYEVDFQKRNFMHLAGIKSTTMGAEQFFEACLDDTITLEDCTPKHSVNNMHAKISVLDQLLDFRHAKCYKIGEKDLVTNYICFRKRYGLSFIQSIAL